MADKRITDLQLRDDVSDSLSFPSDDGIQSYRVTAAQIKTYILAASSIATSMIANLAVTRPKIAEAERIPIGAVMPFAGSSAPTGFLMCDGSAVSRTTYSALFAAIGTAHGTGDGSTTFNLPDYRGRFLRGVDGGAARDPDRAARTAMATGGNTGDNVGSAQTSQYGAHYHLAGPVNPNDGVTSNWNVYGHDAHPTGGTWTNVGGAGSASSTHRQPRSSTSGGNETRPTNAYVHFIIKV